MSITGRRFARRGAFSAVLSSFWVKRGVSQICDSRSGGIPREKVTPNGRGELVIDMRQRRFRPLCPVGGVVSIEVDGDRFPIMVYHRGKHSFNALSSNCGCHRRSLRGIGAGRFTSHPHTSRIVAGESATDSAIAPLVRFRTVYSPTRQTLTIAYKC